MAIKKRTAHSFQKLIKRGCNLHAPLFMNVHFTNISHKNIDFLDKYAIIILVLRQRKDYKNAFD